MTSTCTTKNESLELIKEAALILGAAFLVSVTYIAKKVCKRKKKNLKTIIDKIDYGNKILFGSDAEVREEVESRGKIYKEEREKRLAEFLHKDISVKAEFVEYKCEEFEDDEEDVIDYNQKFEVKKKYIIPSISGKDHRSNILPGKAIYKLKEREGEAIDSVKYYKAFGPYHPYVYDLSLDDVADERYLMSLPDGKFIAELEDRTAAKAGVRDSDYCVDIFATNMFFLKYYDEGMVGEIASYFKEGGRFRFNLDGTYMSRDEVIENFLIPMSKQYIPRYVVMRSGNVKKGFIADDPDVSWIFHPSQNVIERYHEIYEDTTKPEGTVCWYKNRDRLPTEEMTGKVKFICI